MANIYLLVLFAYFTKFIGRMQIINFRPFRFDRSHELIICVSVIILHKKKNKVLI